MIQDIKTKAAVVGLGLIGSQWATHLHTDGILAASWNRTPKPDFPLFTSDLNLVPSMAAVIHIAVSDEQALLSVIDQLAPSLLAFHLVIQSTTIDPATSSRAKHSVESKGAAYLEAPFTGSLPAARERRTIFYLGGDEAVMERAIPYLGRISEFHFKIGNNEQACVLKLSMNLQIASSMEALAEALTLTRRAGIPDDVFFAAFTKNAAYSGVAALKEPKLRAGDFSPQFSIKHMAKDMRLLLKSAGGNLPLLNAVREVLINAEASGLSNEDFCSVIKLLPRN